MRTSPRARRSVALFAALVAGCSAQPRPAAREAAGAALQWPVPPATPKLTFVDSLRGFAPRRTFGATLRSIVAGGAPRERNAFVLPVAVATGADGRIAVADLGRGAVHFFLPAERGYRRLTGGREAPMRSPVGVVFDGESKLFVTDSSGAVFRFGADGELEARWTSAGAEELERPTGLAWSPARRLLYVVDTLAHRVHAFHPDGAHAFSFGRRGDDPGGFNFPTHIAWAPPGELYVTDSLNFRVAFFDDDGLPLGAFGRHGDGSGDLAMPKGIAVDRQGVVYVADALFDNVQLFNRRGDFLLTLGERGTRDGEFWIPSGLFVSPTGELWVCDTYNRRVQSFRITEDYESPGS